LDWGFKPLRLALFLTAAMAVALPQVAAAQDAPPPEPASAATSSIIAYPAAFFASAQPSTALDMVNRLPGFSLDTGNNVRGFGAGGNVLINNERPATKSDPLDEILRRIPAGSVERIELIHAGATGYDMQGRSLLANVVLKKTAEVSRTLNVSTYIYPDGYFGPTVEYQTSRSEGVNVTEGAIKAFTDRTDLTSDDASRTRYVDGHIVQQADLNLWDHIWGGDAKASIQRGLLGGKYRVNGLIQNTSFKRQEQVSVIYPSDAFIQNNEALDEWNGELGGQYDRKIGQKLTLTLTGLQRLDDTKYDAASMSGGATNRFQEHDLSGETILRGVGQWTQTPTLSYEAGLEGAYNFLHGETHFAQESDVTVEELRGEAFGKTSWQPSPKLSVEAGIHAEYSQISESGDNDLTREFFYPKPRVALVWSPSKDNQFRFRIERKVGQLDFGDFVASSSLETGNVDASNPELHPSRTWVYEAAYERHFWGEGAAVFTYEHGEVEDVVDVLPFQGFDAPGNIGKGSYDHLTVDVTVPLQKIGIPGGRLKLWSSWINSSVTDPVTGEERRFSGQGPLACEGHFTQDIPGGRWSWGIGAYCKNQEWHYRIREVQHFTTEAQLESFVQYKPRKDLTIRVDVQNMTSRTRTRERVIYDGPRDTGNILFTEQRPVAFAPWVWVRIRKSL
jgi:hypothetical protein